MKILPLWQAPKPLWSYFRYKLSERHSFLCFWNRKKNKDWEDSFSYFNWNNTLQQLCFYVMFSLFFTGIFSFFKLSIWYKDPISSWEQMRLFCTVYIILTTCQVSDGDISVHIFQNLLFWREISHDETVGL